MGTNSHSLVRRAQKGRGCERCRNWIARGEHYLSYAPGLRRRIPYCLACATRDPVLSELPAVMAFRAGVIA
jgi:hypothetical protein